MNKTILIFIAVAIVVVVGFVWQSKKVLGPTINLSGNNIIAKKVLGPTINLSGNNIIALGGKTLDLSNQGISKIPQEVFSQTSLQELNVSGNNLTGAIQAEIRELKNLRILNASHNQMTGVPAEMGQLQNLEILDLSYNQLTGLPQELGNLQNLKILDLTGNQISQQDLNYIRNKLPATAKIISD